MQNKKAIYTNKKTKQRVVVIGVSNTKHAINLLGYVVQRTGWQLTQIRVKVKLLPKAPTQIKLQNYLCN